MTDTNPTATVSVKFGFERQILSERTFNVLCVTKRNKALDVADFHFPIKGEAKVVAILETAANGVQIARTEVTFQGKRYAFSHVRNGLSGDALVIGIFNLDDVRYTVWELYTDTPSAGPDGDTPPTTPEDLHTRAEYETKKHNRRW